MSALLKPQTVERRIAIDPLTGERLKRLLIIGGDVDALAGAFARILPAYHIDVAARPDQAVLAMSAGYFDAILVDCSKDERFHRVAILAAKQFKQGHVALLASEEFAPDQSLQLPNLTLLSNRSTGGDLLAALGAKRQPEQEVVAPASEETVTPSTVETLVRSSNWIANLLPRLTPLYSLIYKNLALTILGALFAAFVAFGIMITFFLTSNKWSAPITLSPGHELVTKIERDLSDLNVRENQINEQIDDARKNLASSKEELARAHQLAQMIEGTISAEIDTRSALKAEIETHNAALRKVAKNYGAGNVNPGFNGNLSRDFGKRLITRNTYDAGKLAQLEAAHRTALIRNDIAANEVEVSRLKSTLVALRALSGNVEGGSAPSISQGGADLVPLLNQVIDVRKGVEVAASENANAVKREALLLDSLKVVETSVAQMQSTPLARAIKENITVLFVPYENADQYAEGEHIYACAIGIFFCSDVGTVGKAIPGETVATHPFFNKPVRGSFVEAKLTDQEAAKKEIVHVKRRPLFF